MNREFMYRAIENAKIAFEADVMFGASRVECGNYLELDLDSAKREAKRYLDALNSRAQDFKYKE